MSEEREVPLFAMAERMERAAEARGFARAVAMLRDDERYRQWWTSLKPADPAYEYWEPRARRHLADYLETVADLGGGA